MRLTKDDIGKKVKHSNWSKLAEGVRLLGIYEDDIWVAHEYINPISTHTYKNDGWQIQEPKKKVSEIIREKLKGQHYFSTGQTVPPLRSVVEYANDRLEALISYLDETAEEKA